MIKTLKDAKLVLERLPEGELLTIKHASMHGRVEIVFVRNENNYGYREFWNGEIGTIQAGQESKEEVAKVLYKYRKFYNKMLRNDMIWWGVTK